MGDMGFGVLCCRRLFWGVMWFCFQIWTLNFGFWWVWLWIFWVMCSNIWLSRTLFGHFNLYESFHRFFSWVWIRCSDIGNFIFESSFLFLMQNINLVKGICMKFPDLWDAKIKKKYTPKKNNNNHIQDSIYMVWQIAYVHRVAGIWLFLGKNTKCGSTVFLSKKKRRHQKPNLQNNSFYIRSID